MIEVGVIAMRLWKTMTCLVKVRLFWNLPRNVCFSWSRFFGVDDLELELVGAGIGVLAECL